MKDPCAVIDQLAEQNKRAAMANAAETKYKDAAEKLAKLLEEDNTEAIALAMQQNADDAIDAFTSYLLEDTSTSRFIDSVAYNISDEDLPVAREYIALVSLKDNEEALNKIIDSFFDKKFKSDKGLRALPGFVLEQYRDPAKEFVDGQLNQKLSAAREALRIAGADLADTDDVFSEINELAKEFEDAQAAPYVVPYYHDGEMELVETDPFISKLRNYRYVSGSRKDDLMGKIGSVMIGINRIARTFETVFNPTSYRNQSFRDPFDAIVKSGVYHFTGTISKELQTNYGHEIVEWLKNDNPENWKYLEQQALETDSDPEALAIETLFARSSINSITLSKFLRKPVERGEAAVNRSFWGEQAQKTKSAIGKVTDILAKPAEAANDVREVGVRKLVANNMILKCLRNGKTVEEALNAARFASANATTNYGRMLVHLENFRRTVNYFGAGVNSFKSFWRMFELDPVGITMRLNMGIIIPIIACVIFSLSNEKSRKVYRSLREYDKKNQLVIVIDGKLYTVPIPQDMYGITSLVRSSVESLFDGNRHSFWELAMNDVLGFGPVDFSDFMDIDANRFADDATFLERLGGLGLSFVNQFSDVATRSLIEATFNIDTYTGKPIDTSYKEFDEEGNLIVINPQTTGKFAEELGNLTGWSAPIISHTLKNIIGQVGVNVLNTIVGGQTPLKLLENAAEDLLSFEGSNYDRINQEWNAYISGMWRRKEELLEEYNQYSSQINRENDPEKREKLRTDRQNLIDPFLNDVANAVKTLKEKYPGSYDQFRFGAVVSLLTFDTGTTAGNTAEQRADSLNTYYENLEQAYIWMQKLGIQSSDTSSLLGYVTKNKKTGEVEVKYNTPTSILVARDAYMNKGDRNTAELKMLLKAADISSYDKTNSDEYKTAKAAGKASLKEYKDEWNTKVVKEIAPFVKNMGVENVVANDAVRDLLNDYLFIDNPYKVKEYLLTIFKEAK